MDNTKDITRGCRKRVSCSCYDSCLCASEWPASGSWAVRISGPCSPFRRLNWWRCEHDEKKLAGDLSAVQGNLGGPGERSDFSAIAKYRDVRQMLEDPSLDAVDLCLPTHLHAPVAIWH